MITIFINLLALIVMVFFGIRKGIDRSVMHNRLSMSLFWIGLLILTLYGAFYMTFGIGEVTGGDISGIFHFGPAIIIFILVYLSWRRPYEGGIVLIATGIVSGIRMFSALQPGPSSNYAGFIIATIPNLVSGLFLLAASLTARKPSEKE